jgi:hypothetical protein
MRGKAGLCRTPAKQGDPPGMKSRRVGQAGRRLTLNWAKAHEPAKRRADAASSAFQRTRVSEFEIDFEAKFSSSLHAFATVWHDGGFKLCHR